MESGVAGGEIAYGVMTEPVRSLVDALPEVVAAWEHALSEHNRAVRRGEATIARAEGRLQKALDGMSVRRWRNLVSSQVALVTVSDGREMHVARKRRPAVEAALQALAEAKAGGKAEVAVARRELTDATSGLLAYGPMAEGITGCSLTELRSMTRVGRDPQASPDR